MEISDEEKEIINNLIKVKVKELNKFNKVRYGFNDEIVTRVSYESLIIINDIDNYSYGFIITYLKNLKNSIIDNQIEIIDYLPNDNPNVTQDFINWIDKQVSTLKLEVIQNKSIVDNSLNTNNKEEDFYWFKVGLLFATGKINEYLTENKKALKLSAKKTAIELGNESFEKFILANINNYRDVNNINKNVYSSRKKMLKIKDYCTKNKLNIEQDFINRIPLE